MRKGAVFYKGEEAGILTQYDDGSFSFRYHDAWWLDKDKPSIASGLPKTIQEHFSPHLFPYFFHILPEGPNRTAACRLLRIDVDDDFGLLLQVTHSDTIGAVTVKKLV